MLHHHPLSVHRWRKFSHLEPSYVFTTSLERGTSLATQDRHYHHLPASLQSRRESHVLSTTSTIHHSSRRLSLVMVTNQLLHPHRRQSCMPELGVRESIPRQKSAPDTIMEGVERI